MPSRTEQRPWRHLYNTARWKRLRLQQLAAHPLCQCAECEEGEKQVTPATVVDHIKPHRGDERLFFDPANLQSLSKPHHDRLKQQQEQGGYATAVGADGMPLDPAHPWSRG